MSPRKHKILLLSVFSAAVILCVTGVVIEYETPHHPENLTQPVAIVTATIATSSEKTLKFQVLSKGAIVSSSITTNSASLPANYVDATLLVASTSYALADPPNSSLEAAMKLLESQNAAFTFTEHEYPGLGEFVDSLNGVANNSGNYWFLYVNGKESSAGISETFVHSNDSIQWKYEHE